MDAISGPTCQMCGGVHFTTTYICGIGIGLLVGIQAGCHAKPCRLQDMNIQPNAKGGLAGNSEPAVCGPCYRQKLGMIVARHVFSHRRLGLRSRNVRMYVPGDPFRVGTATSDLRGSKSSLRLPAWKTIAGKADRLALCFVFGAWNRVLWVGGVGPYPEVPTDGTPLWKGKPCHRASSGHSGPDVHSVRQAQWPRHRQSGRSPRERGAAACALHHSAAHRYARVVFAW